MYKDTGVRGYCKTQIVRFLKMAINGVYTAVTMLKSSVVSLAYAYHIQDPEVKTK
jgi:hypothetical protein